VSEVAPATGPATGPGHGADAVDGAASGVTVYWRPGCPYCMRLRRGLARAGLATTEVDIWSDPSAAAFVRAHAGGNETVPTVDVAGTVVVNPSARRVVDLAAGAGLTVAPHLTRWWRPFGG
jgi:mycoredoxin